MLQNSDIAILLFIPGDVIFAISQSGETADTIVAIEKAKEQGAFIFGVVNVVGSSIARISHAGAYTHAGPEIGVASTKAFTAQVGGPYYDRVENCIRKTNDYRRKIYSICSQNYMPFRKKRKSCSIHADHIRKLAEKYKEREGCFIPRSWK